MSRLRSIYMSVTFGVIDLTWFIHFNMYWCIFIFLLHICMCIWGGICTRVCRGKVHRLMYACIGGQRATSVVLWKALHSSETESFIGLKLME